MKQIIMILLSGWICISQINATQIVDKPFVYWNVGSIGGYPAIGGGYRAQYNYQGFDIAGKFTPWAPYPPAASIHGHYLLYPKQKGIYIGGGFGYTWEAEVLRSGSTSLDAVLGYQWETNKGRKLFFEVEGVSPLKDTCCSPIWPSLTFGVSF